MLLHDGRKTPDSPNFTHDRLFETRSMPAYVLPGYEEPLGGCWVHGFQLRLVMVLGLVAFSCTCVCAQACSTSCGGVCVRDGVVRPRGPPELAKRGGLPFPKQLLSERVQLAPGPRADAPVAAPGHVQRASAAPL